MSKPPRRIDLRNYVYFRFRESRWQRIKHAFNHFLRRGSPD